MMTADLTRYVETMPPGIRAKLAEWGILSAARVAASKPLIEHIADWKAALAGEGKHGSPCGACHQPGRQCV
jgi:hypothetical protein